MKIENKWIVDRDRTIFGDIDISNGIIREVKEKNGEGVPMEEVIMPAFIDLHAHFREPGFTDKEDIQSGSRAAVKGGYTLVTLMANTKPVCDNMAVYQYINARSIESGLITVNQCISGTKGLKGKDISHLYEIEGEKIKTVSDDGCGVMDDGIMEEILEICRDKGWTFMSHAEDYNYEDYRERENRMTERHVSLALKKDCGIHMCHVSTEESLEFVKEGKKQSEKITCEVTPHHLFSLNDIGDYKVNPPIRSERDSKALIHGIKKGYVDVIATDHAPHTPYDKENGAPGISGIEWAFPLCYTKLVESGEISLNKLSQLMSSRPAEILGMKRGLIREGYTGDLVIVAPQKQVDVTKKNMVSKGKNSPFHGMRLKGEVLKTIRGGKIIYERGKYDNR